MKIEVFFIKTVRIILLTVFSVVAVLFAVSTVQNHFIKDTTPPQISCSSDLLELSVRDGEEVLLSGVSAYDAQDGDLSDEIIIQGVSRLLTTNSAKISYIVFDRAGNMASCSRTLRYTDYTLPRFSLTKPLNYPTGSTVQLSDRLFAEDALDGDISSAIQVYTNNLMNGSAGDYSIEVQVTNSMGNTSVLPLTVHILRQLNDPRMPVILLDSYLIYLSKGDDFDALSHVTAIEDSGSDSGYADTSLVEVDGLADTGAEGIYEINYSYTNSYHRTATVTLTVVVE